MNKNRLSPQISATGRRRLMWWGAGFGVLAAAVFVAAAAYVAWLVPSAPSIEDLREVRLPQPSVVVSADGETLATFRRGRLEQVTLQQVSPHVIRALLATEDTRFFRHHGIDVKRSIYAIWETMRGRPQGGSTITQQLVRNLFPQEIGRSRNLDRKIKEIVTALRIEQLYSKEQILAAYLNTVSFPYNVYGIEMAARTYFGKPAASLDTVESATLVGMLKGPQYYNPTAYPERVKERRNLVLRRMLSQRDLTNIQYAEFRSRPLRVNLSLPSDPPGSAPHFVEYVRKWLTEWASANDADIYADGLRVETTLDSRLQEAASGAVGRQAAALQDIADVEWGQGSGGTLSLSVESYGRMRKNLEPFGYFWKTHTEFIDTLVRETPEYKRAVLRGTAEAAALARLKALPGFLEQLKAGKSRLESGFVAIDPSNGEVKAWVGSRDFLNDQYDHVAQAQRQPGSTFKPFVYGAALERGHSPNAVYHDNPVQIRLADGTVWRPTDMEGATGQAMTMRQGLIYSKNTITAQVMQDVGVPDVLNLAQAMGINQSKLDPVPSLALGTSSVTLLEMVSAYATIADRGEYRKPVVVRRILDRGGKVIAEFGGENKRAMTERSATMLIDMMRDVVGQGTGQAIRGRFGIVADVAGKTGTTQNNTDGWFILMHPNLVAGAWVGFNDARVTMRSAYWGQGGHSAVLVVGDFFREALKQTLIDSAAQFPRIQQPGATTTALMSPAQDGGDAAGIAARRDEDTSQAKGVVVIEGAASGDSRPASDRAGLFGKWQRVDAIPQGEPPQPE